LTRPGRTVPTRRRPSTRRSSRLERPSDPADRRPSRQHSRGWPRLQSDLRTQTHGLPVLAAPLFPLAYRQRMAWLLPTLAGKTILGRRLQPRRWSFPVHKCSPLGILPCKTGLPDQEGRTARPGRHQNKARWFRRRCQTARQRTAQSTLAWQTRTRLRIGLRDKHGIRNMEQVSYGHY
jgi:hypothetical protein